MVTRLTLQQRLVLCVEHAPDKRLQRTVMRRRGRAASASFHCARAARWCAQRAAAELRRLWTYD